MTHDCPTGYHYVPGRSCYLHGCRCDACCDANRDYLRHYQRRVRYAGRGRHDAAPTRALLAWLIDVGATEQWIADVTGLAQSTVNRLRTGTVRRTYEPTAQAVEALARAVGAGAVHTPRARSSVPDRPCESCGRRERPAIGRTCRACYRQRAASGRGAA